MDILEEFVLVSEPGQVCLRFYGGLHLFSFFHMPFGFTSFYGSFSKEIFKIKNMKLGEFIKNFSHNNVIRLVYKNKSGHEVVLNDWNDVSMDWEVNKQKGKFRHFVDNEVLGLTTISFGAGQGIHHADALNIVVERLENQPYVDEVLDEQNCHSETLS
jgi:hypothetical protein